jgi:hypothetical protein
MHNAQVRNPTWKFLLWGLLALILAYLLYLTLGKFRPETMWSNLLACLHYIGLWFLPARIYWLLPLLFVVLWRSKLEVLRFSQFEKLCLVLLFTGVLARVPLYREDLTEFDRYMSVLYPMGVFLFCQLMTKAQTIASNRAIYALLVLITLYQLVRILKNAILWHGQGCAMG